MVNIRALSQAESFEMLTSLLHRAYARLGSMGLNYTAVDQTVETTRRRAMAGVCYVAEIDGLLVGTITIESTQMHQNKSGECEYFARQGVASAHQFAVCPDHQGMGIGRGLLMKAECWAHGNGFSELAIDTAEVANHLISLYTRLNFVPVGHVQWNGKTYRSVVMSKRLL